MNSQAARLPSNRDENWKYANLRALARARFEPSPAPAPGLLGELASVLPAALEGFPRLVLLDGHPVEAQSALPAGVTLASGTRAGVDFASKPPVDASVDRHFADLNHRYRVATCRIDVPAGGVLALEVLCIAAGTGHPAIEVRLGAGARLTLIERHLVARTDSPRIANLHLHLELAEGARLAAARLGQHDARTQFVETVDARLDTAAEATFVQLVEGGAASRSTAFVELAGRGAAVDWHAATLGESTQCHDAYVRISHAAPDTRTQQVFRGIAAARSRIAFNGHMLVRPAAVGTRTAQSLKCLLAGTEAEADVRPQLEIHTDAVQASHGATVGMLDADMLFYLLSRGIPPAAAESLLKWAFISDVLSRLPSAALRTQVEAALERQLPGAAASRIGS